MSDGATANAEVSARRGALFIVSGPSGSGKSSLSDWALGAMPGLELAVSWTTRARRGDERDGVHYHFVSADEFERVVAEDGFAEWAEVHGYRYGTPRDEVDRRVAAGIDVLLDIDVQGAAQIKRRYPDAIATFLLPPDRATLVRRLTGRGTDSDEVVRARIAGACAEVRELPNYDYCIVNRELEHTFDAFRSVVEAARHGVARLDDAEVERLVASFEGER